VSAQRGLFDSVLPNYVERCLELGAKMVKRTKGTVGMVLCPSCKSEKGLRPRFDGAMIVSHACICGHIFNRDEEVILTFQNR
jgi:hypothetical protein